jgi:H+/Cl- antiporter ClcA
MADDASPDPVAIMRSREYQRLLVFAAILGVPISTAAYFFIRGTVNLQTYVYQKLPGHLGFDKTPDWWPIPLLFIAGAIVGCIVKYLPGKGGEIPVEGLGAGSISKPNMLIGILIAAFASIGLGAVVGPEAPLIALGGGLAYWAITSAKGDAPEKSKTVFAAGGSFAAISALFGNPLLASFLMLESIGLGGQTAALVLIPGLLSAGVGTLIFIGFDHISGFASASLEIPVLPHIGAPTFGEFGYAIAIGIVVAIVGTFIRAAALRLVPYVSKQAILLTALFGVAIAILAMLFSHFTDHAQSYVLFSGESALPVLIKDSATFSVGALLMLLACKGIAYCLAISSFRGGPVFPSLFLGTALGIALSHLPGLEMVPAIAMGIGAMSVVMLRLPFTSVLLASLLVSSDSLNVMPLVIVTVVVAFVVSLRINARDSAHA